MKIVIMGTGGVGGYYGGLLARHGHEVIFIARGAHLDAIRARGLQVKSVHGDFTIAPARATDNPAEVGTADLVLFCVKTVHTDEAAQAIRPVVGPETTVVSLQNGIDAAERIGAVVGMEHMLGGMTKISSFVESPGVIRQVSQFRTIVIGEFSGEITPRVEAIVEAFRPTGVTIEATTDIRKVLWTKFVFISAISGVGALVRLEIGAYRHVPETRALLEGMMREVERLARAQGVSLDADVVEQSLAFIDNAAPDIKPSMQRDVESGRPSELESMVGVIGRLGRELGIPTPIADTVYAALLPGHLRA
ncbi:MAG: 2-dehydropantoate 2-reductase, partial [Anaerolineae bacterium]